MVDPVPRERVEGIGLAAVRILLGLLWLQNVGWKLPPEFSSVAKFVDEGIEHPVFPPYSAVLDAVVAPNIELFGWALLLVQLALPAFLLAGLATRLWAAIGAVFSLSIGLTVAAAPNEWGWSYWLMIAAHVAVAVSPVAGRVAGLDGVLRPALGRDRQGRAAQMYLRWAS